MSSVDDINDALATRGADGISRVQVGNQSVERDSVDDQLKLRNDLAAQTAASKPHFGMRMTKCVPPGGG